MGVLAPIWRYFTLPRLQYRINCNSVRLQLRVYGVFWRYGSSACCGYKPRACHCLVPGKGEKNFICSSFHRIETKR
jgi:hypothetical protein